MASSKSAEPKPNDRKHLVRIVLMAIVVCLFFPLLVWRLYDLQCVQHEHYVEEARAQQNTTIKIAPQRGTIFSSSGHPLATSKFLYSAYISPAAVPSDSLYRLRLARRLGELLDLDPSDVVEALQRKGEIILKRYLERSKVLELKNLRSQMDLPPHALYAVKIGKRDYPKGQLAAHVLGYTQRDNYGDNIGLAGVEREYDDEIAGRPTTGSLMVSVGRRELEPLEDDSILNAMGNDIVLTINEAIQHYAEQALADQVAKFEAYGGVCVVLEVGTGGVLAMASYPSFDPNDRADVPPRNFRNRCLTDAISPGSVMKVFTSTALLEYNKLSPYEWIDCDNGYHVFPGGRVIKDSHGMGVVPVWEAFAESSNVAFVKLGLRLEPKELFAQWKKFRFGERTGIDLPGEGTGIMHPFAEWNQQSYISLPIGYEITLTPVQVASAVAAIANGGEYIKPHVLKEVRSPRNEVVERIEPESLGRVCSPQTSQIVMQMMEEVVNEGTGTPARIPGYRVGGKTGTTVKDTPLREGQDPNKKRYYASFVLVLPVESPRFVVYSWIDEPNVRWGSKVAAPLCAKVAEHATRILGIPPSEPIPEDEDDSKEEVRDFPMVLADDDSSSEDSGMDIALPGPELALPAMPDLRGKTVREVVDRLNELGIEAQLVGWGLATRQQPAPGERATHSKALVIFEPPAKSGGRVWAGEQPTDDGRLAEKGTAGAVAN